MEYGPLELKILTDVGMFKSEIRKREPRQCKCKVLNLYWGEVWQSIEKQVCWTSCCTYRRSRWLKRNKITLIQSLFLLIEFWMHYEIEIIMNSKFEYLRKIIICFTKVSCCFQQNYFASKIVLPKSIKNFREKYVLDVCFDRKYIFRSANK